jgi:hypothetical protein
MSRLFFLLSLALFSSSILAQKKLRVAIEDHIEQQFGEIEQVLHEITSTDDLAIDVIWVKTKLENGEKVNALITNGMSQKKMLVSKDKKAFERIELMILLPDNWLISSIAFQDENNYWPIRLLKTLARFPHTQETYFDEGHTVEEADRESYANNNKFKAAILVPSKYLKEDLIYFRKKVVKIYTVKPMYEMEMNMKLEKGYSAVKDKILKLDDVVDIDRAPIFNQE